MRRRSLELLLVLVAAAAPAAAGTREVRIDLRVQPTLELHGTEKVFIGPIFLEPSEESARRVDVTAVRELDRYLRKLLKRQTRLQLLPADESLTLPTADPNQLLGMADFWRALAERTGADYVVAAAVDVEVRDRTGYTSEKYVSPEDGKTYFRQVMVEDTGFKYDILLLVFAASGELVHQEQISDFQERDTRKLEDFKDMFEGLYTLENRLLGVFVPRSVQGRRYLYTG
jgi:hypothetical protein